LETFLKKPMSKKNIFDLSKLVDKSNDIEIKHDETQNNENSLYGYELVPKNEWEKIPYGTHIRYKKNDGSFKKGGFVKAIWQQKDSKGNDSVKIDLTNGFGERSINWSIYLNNIDKIWQKTNNATEVKQVQSQAQAQSQFFDQKEEIDYLNESMKHMKKEMQNMNNELKKMFLLIKKLHGLK
jgi:hypothetical protein